MSGHHAAGVSVRHHLLTAYTRSLLMVFLSQFSRKRFPGSRAGVIRLAERSAPLQVMPVDTAHAMTQC